MSKPVPVYVEWIDMPGGTRLVTDGPFDFLTVTYDTVWAQPFGSQEDIALGGQSKDGGWVRAGDDTTGYLSDGTPIIGWYSDISIYAKEA